jgi:hypothetical protein
MSVICRRCGNEMGETNSRVDRGPTLIKPQDGAVAQGERLAFGREPGSPIRHAGERCRDCATTAGGFHHVDCGIHACPACGRQLMSCSCTLDGVFDWNPRWYEVVNSPLRAAYADLDRRGLLPAESLLDANQLGLVLHPEVNYPACFRGPLLDGAIGDALGRPHEREQTPTPGQRLEGLASTARGQGRRTVLAERSPTTPK